jgi:ankyrin repeat protein
MLIRHNVEPNAVTNSNQTPLHIAAMCGGGEFVALLLSVHAEVNCQDEEMKTPIH